MGVKERLREYIKTLNISEREFCRQIGVSSSYVNNIRQSIQPDKMKAIGEKFPELNPMWLLTGDGTMRNGDNTNRISGNNNTAVAGNGNLFILRIVREVVQSLHDLADLIGGDPQETEIIIVFLRFEACDEGCGSRTVLELEKSRRVLRKGLRRGNLIVVTGVSEV